MKPLSIFSFFSLAFFLLLALSAKADLPFQIGQPRMEGSGCPTGSVQAIISPDGSSVSLLFDKFTVEGRKGPNPYDLMRKYCSFHIPLNLAPGYSMDVQKIDYRGFANLTNNNRGFILTTGPAVSMSSLVIGDTPIRTELRNLNGNFTISQPVPQNSRGRCQGIQSLDFATVIQLFGPNPRGPLYLINEGQITIDSADAGPSQDAIRLQISVRPCQ